MSNYNAGDDREYESLQLDIAVRLLPQGFRPLPALLSLNGDDKLDGGGLTLTIVQPKPGEPDQQGADGDLRLQPGQVRAQAEMRTVREGQVALFLKDGQLVANFNPGRYTLDTKNIPVLGL